MSIFFNIDFKCLFNTFPNLTLGASPLLIVFYINISPKRIFLNPSRMKAIIPTFPQNLYRFLFFLWEILSDLLGKDMSSVVNFIKKKTLKLFLLEYNWEFFLFHSLLNKVLLSNLFLRPHAVVSISVFPIQHTSFSVWFQTSFHHFAFFLSQDAWKTNNCCTNLSKAFQKPSRRWS